MVDGNRVGEFELIERIFRRESHRSDVVLGIGDDAAVTRLPPDVELVTATDTLVCGTHFLADAPPASLGHRLLAANLSDFAAMGAEPRWANLAISLPEADVDWLERFAQGFFQLADAHEVALTGGDTVRGPLSFTLTLQGCIPCGEAVTRAGASAGDLLFVTGHPGEAAAGRLLLAGELSGRDGAASARLISRFEQPESRVELGIRLRGLASAMIDISDGLRPDLRHLLTASGVGADVQLELLPLSDALAAQLTNPAQGWELALYGGEDYELCIAAPERFAGQVEAVAANSGCPLTRIGRLTDDQALSCSHAGESIDIIDSGFRHFD